MKGFIIIKNKNIKFIKNKSPPLKYRKRYIKIGYKYFYSRTYKVKLQTIFAYMKDYPSLISWIKDYPPLFDNIKSYPIKDRESIKLIVRSIGDTSPVPPNTIVCYEGPTAY